MDTRETLRAIAQVVWVASLAVGAYADLMLWFNRRSEVAWYAITRIPARWTKAQLYTDVGNRYRRTYLVCIAVAITSFLFWQVVIGAK